jgi:hypothetical protein
MAPYAPDTPLVPPQVLMMPIYHRIPTYNIVNSVRFHKKNIINTNISQIILILFPYTGHGPHGRGTSSRLGGILPEQSYLPKAISNGSPISHLSTQNQRPSTNQSLTSHRCYISLFSKLMLFMSPSRDTL